MQSKDFGLSFNWGVSTSAYQIEGAFKEDGKGLSIWDEFVQKKGKIKNNENANISCDFYHNYPKDIAMMGQLKIPNFRFSIAWSRIFPNGIGKLNQGGIDYYNRVIDYCLELDIRPWITLYHWDLPASLQKTGGWTNREIIHWFGDFVEVCAYRFGDRVKDWIVLNEPLVFTGAGYFFGWHAPGKKGIRNFLAAAHHAALCQAEGGRILRYLVEDANIGTSFSCSDIHPFSNSPADLRAALRSDALTNRFFIEPLLGLGYPYKDLPMLRMMEMFMKNNDDIKLQFDMDFIGIQNYTRELVSFSPFIPMVWSKIHTAEKRKAERTLMNWEVYPEGIYNMLKKFDAYSGVNDIIITENGAAFRDNIQNNRINDLQRIQYLEQYLQQVLRAKREGVNVQGYFVWSLLDNFEWAEGYDPGFGLVHVDFSTQKRTIKDSGHWYSRFIQSLYNNSIMNL